MSDEDVKNLPDVDFSQLREFVSEGAAGEQQSSETATHEAGNAEDLDLGQFKT